MLSVIVTLLGTARYRSVYDLPAFSGCAILPVIVTLLGTARYRSVYDLPIGIVPLVDHLTFFLLHASGASMRPEN